MSSQPPNVKRGREGQPQLLTDVASHLVRLTLEPSAKGHRSEEHTSELQSLTNLVCRLLLEKKKTKHHNTTINKEAISFVDTLTVSLDSVAITSGNCPRPTANLPGTSSVASNTPRVAGNLPA